MRMNPMEGGTTVTYRGGYTLAEALVAIVMVSMLGVIALRLLTLAQRSSRYAVEQSAVQATARAAVQLVATETRELETGPDGADLQAIALDNMTYRAVRSAGAACAVAAGSVRLRRSLQYGYRPPSPGRDSLLLFIEQDPATDADDRWRAFAILPGGGAGTCPDGAAALVVSVAIPADSAALVVLDAPMRTFETTQLRLYQSGGFSGLGVRSVSAGESTAQPALGPLAADGLQLDFRDASGAATTLPRNVRSIGVTVLAVGENRVRAPAGMLRPASDTLAG
ncbi:MAG: hypothetical protein ABI637_11385, partial [Gemmatimonadota bacterium]